jgi:hypothetical protein
LALRGFGHSGFDIAKSVELNFAVRVFLSGTEACKPEGQALWARANCTNACVTVEERPFQGRVTHVDFFMGFSPVV